MTKVFQTLLPAAEEQAASPWLMALNNAQAVKDLCAVVYFPVRLLAVGGLHGRKKICKHRE